MRAKRGIRMPPRFGTWGARRMELPLTDVRENRVEAILEERLGVCFQTH